MKYTLTGRALTDDEEYPKGLCIFCGAAIAHVDDPGHDGVPHVGYFLEHADGTQYLMCWSPCCAAGSAAHVENPWATWDCTCGTMIVGDTCRSCKDGHALFRVEDDDEPDPDPIKFSLDELVKANADAPLDTLAIDRIKAMKVGDLLLLGGGAVATTKLRRVS